MRISDWSSDVCSSDLQRADIDRLFASDRYEDILAALKADGSEWADKQITTLATKSPQTIKVALRQLAEGGRMTDFADNMRMEYRIACHVIRRPDFVEGRSEEHTYELPSQMRISYAVSCLQKQHNKHS